MNALQTFDRLRAHAILHQDFRLQHQVLQRGRAQSRFFDLDRLLFFFYSGEARSNYVEALVVDLAAQCLQTFLMSGLVRINLRRTIEGLGGEYRFGQKVDDFDIAVAPDGSRTLRGLL